MNLISTSWSCARCGCAYISAPPEHGLCAPCIRDLEMLAQLAPVAQQPCPQCGGPVCADCGQALITLLPDLPPGLREPVREVTRDDG